MAERQPPNTQTLRPQHLTQVGHEGNPVEFHALDTDGPPTLYPIAGSGLGAGGGDTALLPLSSSGGTGNCFSGDGTVPLVVTGGVGPYTWTTDVGTIVVDDNTAHATLHPPTNSGSSVSGNAYGKCAMYCCVFTSCSCQKWGCAGQVTQSCGPLNCNDVCGPLGKSCSCSSCSGCTGLDCCLGGHAGCMSVHDCDTGGCCGNDNIASDGCACLESNGAFLDLRTAGMISNGCNPCATAMQNGATITVTDSEGSSFIFHVTYAVSQ